MEIAYSFMREFIGYSRNPVKERAGFKLPATLSILALFRPSRKDSFQPPSIFIVDHLEQLVLAGVMLPVDLLQVVGHYVGVADGRLDAGVPEKLLDVADAGAVFKEMRGRRVADRMGRNLFFVHVKTPQEFPEAFADGVLRQMSVEAGKDPGFHIVDARAEEVRQEIVGHLGERHHAVAVELAAHYHEAAREVDVLHLEAGRLAYP